MGSVWIAEHLTLQSHVAVKFISAAHARDEAVLTRFSREAATAAQMRHPHVVQIFDHGVTPDGAPYMVMELLDGENLGDRLIRLGALGLLETSRIVSQTCKALSKAHLAGLIHRDIKPDNIFITDLDGEPFVKVLDFGIAKRFDDRSSKSLTATGSMVGTPYYMSPEQAMSSKHVDHRCDLWSLSVVAYHCLTGNVPFDGETVGALFVAIDRAEFRPPSELRADVPISIDAWFARALNRKFDLRFASAKELAETFEAATRGEVRFELVGGNAPVHAVTSAGQPVATPDGVALPPTLTGTSVTSPGAGARSLRLAIIAATVLVLVGVLGLVALARRIKGGGESMIKETAGGGLIAPSVSETASSALAPLPPLGLDASTGPAAVRGTPSASPPSSGKRAETTVPPADTKKGKTGVDKTPPSGTTPTKTGSKTGKKETDYGF